MLVRWSLLSVIVIVIVTRTRSSHWGRHRLELRCRLPEMMPLLPDGFLPRASRTTGLPTTLVRMPTRLPLMRIRMLAGMRARGLLLRRRGIVHLLPRLSRCKFG